MTQAAVLAANASLMTTPSGTTPSYLCRAWVNFNGTGTVAIRASGNVSSITDNGVGDYTVNFTTAMPDANYAPQLTCRDNGLANLIITMSSVLSLKSTTQLRIISVDRPTGTLTDTPEAAVTIFR